VALTIGAAAGPSFAGGPRECHRLAEQVALDLWLGDKLGRHCSLLGRNLGLGLSEALQCLGWVKNLERNLDIPELQGAFVPRDHKANTDCRKSHLRRMDQRPWRWDLGHLHT